MIFSYHFIGVLCLLTAVAYQFAAAKNVNNGADFKLYQNVFKDLPEARKSNIRNVGEPRFTPTLYNKLAWKTTTTTTTTTVAPFLLDSPLALYGTISDSPEGYESEEMFYTPNVGGGSGGNYGSLESMDGGDWRFQFRSDNNKKNRINNDLDDYEFDYDNDDASILSESEENDDNENDDDTEVKKTDDDDEKSRAARVGPSTWQRRQMKRQRERQSKRKQELRIRRLEKQLAEQQRLTQSLAVYSRRQISQRQQQSKNQRMQSIRRYIRRQNVKRRQNAKKEQRRRNQYRQQINRLINLSNSAGNRRIVRINV